MRVSKQRNTDCSDKCIKTMEDRCVGKEAKKVMKVLWICNQMPSILARGVGLKAGNKEGWVTGMAHKVSQNRGIEFAIAFPVKQAEMLHGVTEGITFFSFQEDLEHPENYDSGLEASLGLICEEFSPDVIHCFGTEFPHTLAILRLKEWREHVLVHLQGLMVPCSKVYDGGLPGEVIERSTFRDILKKDSIWQQKEKFIKRGEHETEALKLCHHACGRTSFDREYILGVNHNCNYYMVNETLRPEFYEKRWKREEIVSHRIIVSQGNYPLKGVHYMLEAMGILVKEYPDITLHVAGDKITGNRTLKEKLKISSYGKYLLSLLKKYQLEDKVVFTGSLRAEQMRQEFLSSEVFVLPSLLENSPNSLGEAMLLGMPCVATKVGGVPSIAAENEVFFCREMDAVSLADAIRNVFEDSENAVNYGERAHSHAVLTHDAEANYKMLLWVYEKIVGRA